MSTVIYPTIPIPPEISGSVILRSLETQHPPWNYFRSIATHVTTIPQQHGWTDRQTEGRLAVAIARCA